jgi:hypothetical protein
MSSPHSSGPPPQSSSAWTIALVVVAALSVMLLVCCGGLAAIGSLFYARAEHVAAEVKSAVQRTTGMPTRGPPAPAWQQDWIAMSQLTPAYSAALDAVASDPTVLENLGEPIESATDGDTLFRRDKKGGWTGGNSSESLEFDIQGPKGKAEVHVVAGAPPVTRNPPGFYRGVWPLSITVTLEDGSEISVPPPDNKATAEAP